MTATSVTWVSPELNASPRSGGTIRSLRLLTALSERASVNVVVIGSASPEAELLAASGCASVVRFQGLSGARARAVALRRGWPLSFARHWSADASRTVASLGQTGAVVLDRFSMFPYRPSSGRYTVDLHDVESSRQATMVAPTSRVRRLERARDVRLVTAWERELIGDPNAEIVVVSDTEQSRAGRGTVIPNGADIPRVVPPRRSGGSILFVGALDYEPNREALRWWASSVAPLLPPSLPRLTAVGRAPGDVDFGEAIDVRGEVADVRPYLTASSVVVVPLQRPGGIRLKTLEGLAWARPVVSTPQGVEGLPVHNGRDVLVAEDPRSFAAATESAWRDDALATRLGTAGRAVAARYDWSSIARSFAELVLGAT